MGNRLNRILTRLFDYPIKRRPICFYRQEDFSSTGEPLAKADREQVAPPTEYDKLVQAFYNRLLAQRKHSKQLQDKNRRFSVQRVTKLWSKLLDNNLSSIYSFYVTPESRFLLPVTGS